MELSGRNVVVTGASQGIGEQLALECAARGAKVLVAARSADRLEALARRIDGIALSVDLTVDDQIDGFISACLDRLGHIDVLINNAGLDTDRAFVELDHETIRAVTRLNLEATMILTRDAARHMTRRGSGHIVNLSSVAGTVPFPGLTAYAGTKAGITNFTESLRVELDGTGVDLTLVAPGPTDTAMWDRVEGSPTAYPEPALRRLRRLLFLPKLQPERVARATADAIERRRRFVRLPRRYALFHMLENAPRRLAEATLFGVHLTPPVPAPDRFDGPSPTGAPMESTPNWPSDNRPNQRWPLYTRGNVGEVFPEVVMPLTWTMYGIDAEMGWRSAFERMGLLMPGDLPPVTGIDTDDMVVLGVFGGYAYINASYVRLLGVRAPGADVTAIDQQFFGESDAPAYTPRPGDRNRRSSLRLGRTILRLLRTKDLPAVRADIEQVDAWLDACPTADASDEELHGSLFDFKPLFRHLFSTHIENTFSVALTSGAVADFCVKAEKPELLVSLLGGIGDIESAAPSAAMWRLSRLDSTSPEYVDAFDAFLADFGSRGPNEWDIAAEPWDLRPEVAQAAIGAMRGADNSHDPVSQQQRLAAERAAAVEVIAAALNPIDRWQFRKALASTVLFSQARERSKTTVIRALHSVRLAHRELARRIAERGGPTWQQTCLLTGEEFGRLVRSPSTPADLLDAIAQREPQYELLSSLIPPFIIDGAIPPLDQWQSRAAGRTASADVGAVLTGIAGCPGTARGRAKIVLDPGDPRDLGPGDVLVAPITDPSWTPLFLAAEAVVVDVGATMSHAVIVSRELGIPCVVSAVGATTTIPDGALVEVDGNAGTVTVVALP